MYKGHAFYILHKEASYGSMYIYAYMIIYDTTYATTHMHTHTLYCIYMYILLYKYQVINIPPAEWERSKEGKAEGKRFNQMVEKWPNRSVLGWGTLYLAGRAL